MKTRIPAFALAIAAATNAQAWDDDCDVPIRNWQPRDAVEAFAKEQGWKVKRIKIDDGCYEVYARDEQGRRFEVKLDPATLEIVEFEQDHRHTHGHDGDHD